MQLTLFEQENLDETLNYYEFNSFYDINEFQNIEFNNCLFRKVIANNTIFTNCYFFDCEFDNVDLSNSKFYNCSFVRTKIKGSKLVGCDFEGSAFKKCEIIASDNTYNNFSNTNLKEVILKDLDFTFESGKIYGLIGRNGVGKTTFFNCINGDVDITSGKFIS